MTSKRIDDSDEDMEDIDMDEEIDKEQLKKLFGGVTLGLPGATPMNT